MNFDTDKRAVAELPDLYRRIDDLLVSMRSGGSGLSLASGFASQSIDDNGLWRPLGEYPERIIDHASFGSAARCCVVGERVFIGVLAGGGLTPWERRTFARTEQALSVVFNGTETVRASYRYDGRIGWTVFPLTLPPSLNAEAICAVEIEREGKLILSQRLRAEGFPENVQPKIRRVNARGALLGAVPGVNSDVPVEIAIGDRVDWVLTTPPAQADAPRPFEYEFARQSEQQTALRVSVRDPMSGIEAQGSPICVFGSGKDHFLFANPRQSGDRFAATLLSWKDGKRRPLRLASRHNGRLDTICRVDQDDDREFRYENGRNSFVTGVASLQGEVVIVTDDNSVLGPLPPLQRLLDLLPPAPLQLDAAAGPRKDAADADVVAAVMKHMRAGDTDAARNRLQTALAQMRSTNEIEALLRALGAAQPPEK